MFAGLTMKPEALRIWTTALRSGDWKQTKFRLRRPDGASCCLGVWAELNTIPREQSDSQADWRYTFPLGEEGDRRNWTSLPTAWFEQFFDFNPKDLNARPSKEASVSALIGTLMEFNDDGNRSFEQIADWMEENLQP